MPVKIYSPEDFIYELAKWLWDNTNNFLKKSVKHLIKLKNWDILEINKTKFNPHWPEWDWTEETENDKKAYKQANIDFKNWDVIHFNSIDEFKKRYL